MAVSILYPSTQSLLNGPPRHLLPWARIPRVCEPGPEPQGTQNYTFLAPNGSPCHHLGHGDRQNPQNCGADLTRGVPPPQSQLFLIHFGPPKWRNANLGGKENLRRTPGELGAPGAPWAPWGAHGQISHRNFPFWIPPQGGKPVLPYRHDPWLCCHTITTHVAVLP